MKFASKKIINSNLNLSSIIELLEAKPLVDNYDPDVVPESFFAADLMSDILAFVDSNALILTGLVNIQSIRTAQIADAVGVIYVRGKIPEPETVELAKKINIPIFVTKNSMFECCGRIYLALYYPELIAKKSDEK